jgi:hypothetical protein
MGRRVVEAADPGGDIDKEDVMELELSGKTAVVTGGSRASASPPCAPFAPRACAS